MIYTYKYSTGHDKNGKLLLLTFFRCKSNKSRRSKSRIFSLFSLYPLKTPGFELEIQCKIDFICKKRRIKSAILEYILFWAYTNFFAIACGNRKTAILARKFGVFACKMRENAIILLKIYKKQCRPRLNSRRRLRINLGLHSF